MAVTTLRMIGSIEYSVSASSDGQKPSAEKRAPSTRSASAESASKIG